MNIVFVYSPRFFAGYVLDVGYRDVYVHVIVCSIACYQIMGLGTEELKLRAHIGLKMFSLSLNGHFLLNIVVCPYEDFFF